MSIKLTKLILVIVTIFRAQINSNNLHVPNYKGSSLFHILVNEIQLHVTVICAIEIQVSRAAPGT